MLASKIQCDFAEIDLGADSKFCVRRTAIVGKFSTLCTGNTTDKNTVQIVGTHLDVFDETGKLRTQQIDKIVKNLVDSSKTTIVMGDFNCVRYADYSDDEWSYITKVDLLRGVDTFRLKESDDSNKTDAVEEIERHGFVSASVCVGKPIKCSVWSNRRVDYVFCRSLERQNLKKLVVNSGVVRTAASDHHPVYADFDICLFH